MRSSVQEQIEATLATTDPEVEVLLAEVLSGSLVRLFIDHPEGVSLALCERVTSNLATGREQYALEGSSPGPERPLTKPEHFRRYLGRRARVRTRGIHSPGERSEPVQSFTGELLQASEQEVTVAADTGVVSIPYSDIHRSNLVKD